MRMEYVVVTYPAERDVYVDGKYIGKTGETLRVERGHHTFGLGEPLDYQPELVEMNVPRTTRIKPLHVEDFHPL